VFVIDNILVDEQLLEKQFLCDLGSCHGACCTMKGGAGAPLLEEEVQMIRDAVVPASKYLSTRSLKILAKEKPVVGQKGDYTTLCIDDADCVFVFYEDGAAKCAIERAFFNGETTFRKPISCHLFPARVADFGGPYIYYEEIPECRPALENGKKTGVRAFEMLKESLVRAFGEEWYKNLTTFVEQQAQKEQLTSKRR
jgi:hypothetical protein